MQALEAILLENPDAPSDDEHALLFASKLYLTGRGAHDTSVRLNLVDGRVTCGARESEHVEWCGESTYGMLETVLVSNLISPTARTLINRIISRSRPKLERMKNFGHFKFSWTEGNKTAKHNTTERNIARTAKNLNECWDRLAVDFRTPQAELIGNKRIIAVEVYWNPRRGGSTSSSSNRIFLNSDTVVNDNCRSRTVAAHELFHRVQYSYGYVTGTNAQKWWVEALGSWSQEYFDTTINDYVNRVNRGLRRPERALLQRSYDACHFWKYFGERLRNCSTAIDHEHEAVQQVLDEYSHNGLDLEGAVSIVVGRHLLMSFEKFFEEWVKANYLKELKGAPEEYRYSEGDDVTAACGRKYGPYAKVARVAGKGTIIEGQSWTSGRKGISPYSAHYYDFAIGARVNQLEVKVSGKFGRNAEIGTPYLVLSKAGNWMTGRRGRTNRSAGEWMKELRFDPGRYDRCVLLLSGRDRPGTYQVEIGTAGS